MALNSNAPNSTSDVERVSNTVEGVIDSIGRAPGSIQDILRLSSQSFASKQATGRPLLDEMINNIDRPILKSMAKDVITVLSNWFEDPQLLCCLVQGIWGLFAATRSENLSDTDFAKWVDVLVTFVDVVIVILTSNVKKITIMIPDFISEIMNGVIGAVLLLLQELLFAIRDSLISSLLDAVSSPAKSDQIWAKCLPLSQLIEILKKYINDFGLFAELFEKIKGFISAKFGIFSALKEFDFPKNIQDLEFLYWFRDLLLKMKQATLSFDLCYLPQTAASGGNYMASTAPGFNNGTPVPVLAASSSSDPSAIQGVTVAPDGTILQDTASLRGNSLPLLTNSSVRGFLNKYYGYPLDVVDSLIAGSNSTDAIQGTLSNRESSLNADCPNSPTPGEIVQWALRVRNRNI